MALTASILRVCASYSGGLKRLWLADKADVTSFTLTSNQYSAVTMVATKYFKEIEFYDEFTAEKREKAKKADSGSFTVENEIEFQIQGLTNANRNSIEELIVSSTCGMIAIAEDFNSTKWVIGYNERSAKALKVATADFMGGKQLEDFSGATIILQNKLNELARVFTGSVPTS